MYHFLFSDISELFYETDRKFKKVLIYETQTKGKPVKNIKGSNIQLEIYGI